MAAIRKKKIISTDLWPGFVKIASESLKSTPFPYLAMRLPSIGIDSRPRSPLVLACPTLRSIQRTNVERPRELKRDWQQFPDLSLTATPCGTCFWIMSAEKIGQVYLLDFGKTKAKALTSEILQEGFIATHPRCARHIPGDGAAAKFSLHLSEEERPPRKTFCVDVEIEFNVNRVGEDSQFRQNSAKPGPPF